MSAISYGPEDVTILPPYRPLPFQRMCRHAAPQQQEDRYASAVAINDQRANDQNVNNQLDWRQLIGKNEDDVEEEKQKEKQ